jgi:hypothetical protein
VGAQSIFFEDKVRTWHNIPHNNQNLEMYVGWGRCKTSSTKRRAS